MRIKFKKGLSPEAVASYFLNIVEGREKVIGSVNIYVQEYDEDMKPIKDDGSYIEVAPNQAGLRNYAEYSADLRRSKLKAI
jgi:hypothetical protein